MWTASSDFCKIDNTFLNITVGMEDQLPNCPIFLLKIQFYPLSDQQITPSLRLTPEQISSLCCYPLCAAAGYSSSSSFSFFFFFSSLFLFYFICLLFLSSSSSLLYFYFILFVLYIWSEKNLLKVEFLINKIPSNTDLLPKTRYYHRF